MNSLNFDDLIRIYNQDIKQIDIAKLAFCSNFRNKNFQLKSRFSEGNLLFYKYSLHEEFIFD